ncbi:selT-like protein [Ziziphus jujuba]|uniref:SelT-like protein n=1 Tax=Ziziphus jujuba TaxID=326968 RepID=A0A6P4AM82_ZIZJJ|nr:selT-like protein [Ziziphus jujuba]
MGRGGKLFLMGLSIYLFSTDVANLFTTSPPKPSITHFQDHDLRHPHRPHYQPILKFPSQQEKSSNIGAIDMESNIININFCTSCSYRGNAVKTKKVLETAFPGINVVLGNQPPEFRKGLVSKIVPVVQVAIIGLTLGGEQIFPRMGISSPPPLYYSLRANRFRSIATTWFLGNFLQTFLQTTGAFEVYYNGDLVFSKLKEQRFPGEFELKDLVGKKLTISRTVS